MLALGSFASDGVNLFHSEFEFIKIILKCRQGFIYWGGGGY